MGSTVNADNHGTCLPSYVGPNDQQALALALQIESLRTLALDLMNVVVKLEEFQSRRLHQPIRLADEVERFERSLIESALKLTGGQQTRAARLLGIKLTTLNSKIKRYLIAPSRPVLSAAKSPPGSRAPTGRAGRNKDGLRTLTR
jgi:Bacterial regulatory protein, Fis family